MSQNTVTVIVTVTVTVTVTITDQDIFPRLIFQQVITSISCSHQIVRATHISKFDFLELQDGQITSGGFLPYTLLGMNLKYIASFHHSFGWVFSKVQIFL